MQRVGGRWIFDERAGLVAAPRRKRPGLVRPVAGVVLAIEVVVAALGREERDRPAFERALRNRPQCRVPVREHGVRKVQTAAKNDGVLAAGARRRAVAGQVPMLGAVVIAIVVEQGIGRTVPEGRLEARAAAEVACGHSFRTARRISVNRIETPSAPAP